MSLAQGTSLGKTGWRCASVTCLIFRVQHAQPGIRHLDSRVPRPDGRRCPSPSSECLCSLGWRVCGNNYAPPPPMKPPNTLVALDYQPAVIRTTAETIHISIGGEVRGLSDSTSGNWDLTRTAPSVLGEHLYGFPEAERTQGSLTREAGAHSQP